MLNKHSQAYGNADALGHEFYVVFDVICKKASLSQSLSNAAVSTGQLPANGGTFVVTIIKK
jgi:hypothetical protein